MSSQAIEVPCCMGAALYGPSSCTCAPERAGDPARLRILEERLAQLEQRVTDLEARGR